MKRSLLLFGKMLILLLLTGCGVKPYVDVKSDEYATLQLMYAGDVESGQYITYIEDLSNGCNDSVKLGKVIVDSDKSSKVVKIPVEKPLWISANYIENGLTSSYADYTIFVLIPEKNKHYVVDYMRKDVDFFHAISDFDVYMLEGNDKVEISSSRKREFNEAKECR